MRSQDNMNLRHVHELRMRYYHRCTKLRNDVREMAEKLASCVALKMSRNTLTLFLRSDCNSNSAPARSNSKEPTENVLRHAERLDMERASLQRVREDLEKRRDEVLSVRS